MNKDKAIAADMKWISVKDRLPENGSWILSFDNLKGRHIAWYDQMNMWTTREDKELNEVTHWMPLPAAPGEPTLSSAGKEVKSAQEIAEEIWDEVSYFVDDDLSSLDYVANTNVCRGADFVPNMVRAIELYHSQFKSSPASTEIPVISDEEITEMASRVRIYRDTTEQRRIIAEKIRFINWYREQVKSRS